MNTNANMATKVKYGEVWLCDLGFGIGSEQTGCRPVIVCSNDVGNRHSSISQIVPISSSINKRRLPTHVYLDANRCGLERSSIALCEQSKVVDQGRLFVKLAELSEDVMEEVMDGIMVNFGRAQPKKVALVV